MTQFIRKHPAAAYFALAFAISWGAVAAVIRNGPIPAPPSEAQRLFPFVYLAMLAGPALAGLIMTALVSGRAGLRDFRARLFMWRVAPRWYAIALLTTPLVFLTTHILLAQVSSDFVPALISGNFDAGGPVLATSRASFVLVGLAVGIGAGFFEELGWTGFAIPQLRLRYSAAMTGVIVGILWGAWHFLAILWGAADAFGSVPIPLYLLIALFSFLPPYRVLMVRVYARTQSLLIAVLMHASLTATVIILGPPVSGYAVMASDLAFASTLWFVVMFATTRAQEALQTTPAGAR